MTGGDPELTTRAIVLARTAVGEADLVVQLYTEARGRLGAVARAARKSKRRFAGGLEPLVVFDVALRPRRGSELWSLERAESVDDHRALAADPVSLGHAAYALELVRGLAPPEAADPELLDLVVALWRALAPGPSSALLRAFELALCRAVGSEVALTSCAACGGDVDDDRALFDPSRGGAVCVRCAASSTGLGVRPLAERTRGYLATLAERPLAEARDHEADDLEARVGGRDCMLAIVSHLLGHPPTTLDYVAQVHGGLRRG